MKNIFLVFLLVLVGAGYGAVAEITDISFENPVFEGTEKNFSINTIVSFYSSEINFLFLCISVENYGETYSSSVGGSIGDQTIDISSFILQNEDYDTKQTYDINFYLSPVLSNGECVDPIDIQTRKFSVMKKSTGGYYIPENDWSLVVLVGLIAMFVLSGKNE